MKIIRNLCIMAAAAAILSACERDLPSYEHIHGKPDKEEQEEENPKEEDETPVTPTLGYDVAPTGSGAFIDGELTLEFKSAPTLGTEGKIQIFKEDGTLADMIDMADVAAPAVKLMDDTPYNTTHDLLGPASLKRWRVVNYKPVTVEGNKITIRPHSNKLD